MNAAGAKRRRRAARVVFVDAGVFLGLLAGSDERARGLFERAQAGEVRLETTLLVLAEVVGELEASSRLGRKGIGAVLEAALGTRNLRVGDREVAGAAAAIYAGGGTDFRTACNLAYARARGAASVATFEPARYSAAGEPVNMAFPEGRK